MWINLSLREEIKSEFDVKNKFRESDADENPGLTSETLATFISNVGVVLPKNQFYVYILYIYNILCI